MFPSCTINYICVRSHFPLPTIFSLCKIGIDYQCDYTCDCICIVWLLHMWLYMHRVTTTHVTVHASCDYYTCDCICIVWLKMWLYAFINKLLFSQLRFYNKEYYGSKEFYIKVVGKYPVLYMLIINGGCQCLLQLFSMRLLI